MVLPRRTAHRVRSAARARDHRGRPARARRQPGPADPPRPPGGPGGQRGACARAAAPGLRAPAGVRGARAAGPAPGRADGIVAAVFDHVTIRVSDREAAQRFYDTVLETLAIEATYSDNHFAEWDDF